MPCNARLSIRTSPKVVQRVASCNPNRRRHRTSRGSRPRRHGRCAQWREPGSGQCRILPRILYRRARRHARAYKIDPAFRAASRTTNRIPVRFRSVHAGKQFDAGGPGPGGEGWGPAFPFVSLITCTRYEMFTRYYCVHPYLAYIGASPPGRVASRRGRSRSCRRSTPRLVPWSPLSPAPRHRAHRPCARICVLLRTRPHREGPRTVKTRNRKSKRPRRQRQRRRCRCRRSAVARCNSDYLRVKFKPGKISATNHADTKAMLRLNIWATKFVFMVLV